MGAAGTLIDLPARVLQHPQDRQTVVVVGNQDKRLALQTVRPVRHRLVSAVVKMNRQCSEAGLALHDIGLKTDLIIDPKPDINLARHQPPADPCNGQQINLVGVSGPLEQLLQHISGRAYHPAVLVVVGIARIG